jgi:6-pyruvoyltetrahydropterin/6-carboxytetrahydropterin synthase
MSPSSENVAKFIYDRITEKVKKINLGVSRVTVWESENARVSYYGNGYARYSKPER